MDAGFLTDDFLLSGETARRLFHEVAEHAPIVDLHNHLSPADIADDRVYETLSDLWLGDDHYKWRAMRLAGFDERLITGDADPWERFSAWAATLPRLIRNPLYVWSHLELRRVVRDRSRAQPLDRARDLGRGEPAAARLVDREAPLALRRQGGRDHRRSGRRPRRPTGATRGKPVAMIPTFRPDGAHRLLGDPPAWNAWIDRLEAATGTTIDDLPSLLAALTRSYARFAELGGRASDHGLESLPDVPPDPSLAAAVIRRARAGEAATPLERAVVMLEVVGLAARLAFADESVLQLHLGPLRDVSPRLLAAGRARCGGGRDRRRASGARARSVSGGARA